MRTIRPLGTYLVSSDEGARAVFYYDSSAKALMVHGECRETVRCTNGHATFSFSMQRPLAGGWRVVQLSVGEVEFYKPTTPEPAPAAPAASPAATPVPSTGG